MKRKRRFWRTAALCFAVLLLIAIIPAGAGAAEKDSFIDVPRGVYYYSPVYWALERGITAGTTKNTFSPGDTCTRAQILTFLWRAYGKAEPNIANPFPDVRSDAYYYKAALWAYEKRMAEGLSFDANAPCTRADTMTYLWKLAGRPVSGNNPFRDVPSGADYARAVAWAVSKGITSGTTATTFDPESTCTRAQIVTFLYRDLKDTLATTTPSADTYATLTPDQIYERIAPATVLINTYYTDDSVYGTGTGFFIDSHGLIVTNYHVMEDATSATVHLYNGEEYPVVSVCDYDAALDLALIRINYSASPYLSLCKTGARTGEAVYTLGHSESLAYTFSDGMVSSAERKIDGMGDVRYVQITAPISEGNSGGPLVNTKGQVLGVNTLSLIVGQNLNFAVDIRELEKLDKDGSMTIAEFYEETRGGDIYEDEGFYDVADDREIESNDSFMLADEIINGTTMAGEVSDIEDYDIFYMDISDPCTLEVKVVPYYTEDQEYLECALIHVAEEETDPIYLEPDQYGDWLCHSATIQIDDPEAGYWFLIVCVKDEYADYYDEPAYYAVVAEW